ncbi:Chalcone--flavonone isomerase [Artemisia annua]|uniref:Chalcone-flavonone isomerase family protein n=1 Tax=Artemisia annua TaxID=35608 RepID=A0A2U1N3S7_ARTAN|nr:Chalcone--flavonone isomerase [Artemisia annua]
MAKWSSSTGIQVESAFFPPSVKPPSATNTLFLIGAGVRCVEKQGIMVNTNSVGLYVEERAIQSLAAKWKGKTAEELLDSDEFYNDIATGPFEKLIQVTMIIPIPGYGISERISQLWAPVLKANGCYTDAYVTAVDKFREILKDEHFPPGNSILFTSSPVGSLKLNLAKDGIIAEDAIMVLENEKWGQIMVEASIGKTAAFPPAKQSLASRLADFMN